MKLLPTPNRDPSVCCKTRIRAIVYGAIPTAPIYFGVEETRPSMYYAAQFLTSALVSIVCATLLTLGKLVSPFIMFFFLFSLICSFILAAALMYQAFEEKWPIAVLSLATIAGLFAGWFAAPGIVGFYSLAKKKQELKSNLLAIADAIGKYKLDNGAYPPYLIGGVETGPTELSDDPLIAKGAIISYPVNPYGVPGSFVTYPKTFLTECLQDDKRPCHFGQNFAIDLQYQLGDPYSDRKSTLARFGTASEFDALRMGSVLGDVRSNHGSFCYSAWGGGEIGERKLPFLPGMFFYKEWSDSVDGTSHFVLGAYGSFYDEGYDILGPAPEGFLVASDKSGNGSPLRLNEEGRLVVGNPDGKPDGVVYVLTDEGEWTPKGIRKLAKPAIREPEPEPVEEQKEEAPLGTELPKTPLVNY